MLLERSLHHTRSARSSDAPTPSLSDTRNPLLSHLRTPSRGLLVLRIPGGIAAAKTRELDADETSRPFQGQEGSRRERPRTWRSECVFRTTWRGDHHASSSPVRRSIRALLRSPEDRDAIPGLGGGRQRFCAFARRSCHAVLVSCRPFAGHEPPVRNASCVAHDPFARCKTNYCTPANRQGPKTPSAIPWCRPAVVIYATITLVSLHL